MFFYIFIGLLVFVLAIVITAIAQPPNKLVEHFTQSKTPRKDGPPPPRSEMPETIYYDGHCGLCHGFVKFVVARDTSARYRFSPLDKLSPEERRGLPDSVVVRTGHGVLVKSDAALYVLQGLGGFWAFLAACAKVFPRVIRDFVYDGIARVRYRIFGTRDGVCPLVPPELRKRFEM